MIAQQASVPVNKDPFHKVVLRNDYVEVMRVTIPPGQSTMFHTHSHDGVVVRLTESQVKADVPGEPSTGPQTVHPGETEARAYAKAAYTHRVNNVGNSPFEVIDVEVLSRPAGPESPPVRKPDAEHESARVYRWELAPGVSSVQHTHERPYLIISATPMNLRMTAPDGRSMAHPLKAGDFHWVDGKVTHTLVNDGKENGVIVEVELT